MIKEEGQALALKIVFQRQLDSGVLSFETWADQGIELGELNSILDKLQASIKRQQAFIDIEHEKREIQTREQEYLRWKHDLQKQNFLHNERVKAHADSGRRGDYQMSPQEEANKNNLEATGSAIQMRIDQAKERLCKLEQQIAGE